MLTDMNVARRLERDNWAGRVAFSQTYDRLFPGEGIEVLLLDGGGAAVFVGRDNPISTASGLGLESPASEGDLDLVETFYREREMRPVIDIRPLADPGLFRLLGDRGYRLVRCLTVLCRDLSESAGPQVDCEEAGPGGECAAGTTARVITPGEADFWALTVARGFAGSDDLETSDRISRTNAANPGSTKFLAFSDEEPVGGGAMSVRDGLGYIYSMSVRPAFRRRGLQSALIRTSVAVARSAGCDLVHAMAVPGSTSQRNFERAGFQAVYSTVTMALDPSQP